MAPYFLFLAPSAQRRESLARIHHDLLTAVAPIAGQQAAVNAGKFIPWPRLGYLVHHHNFFLGSVAIRCHRMHYVPGLTLELEHCRGLNASAYLAFVE